MQRLAGAEGKLVPAPIDCQGCPLAKHRLKVVNGNGPANARIVAVGEAPGEQEDKQGRGFVGESGQILRGYMRQVGIDPDSVFYLNCCRCRPPGNRKPTAKEIAACLPYLIDDIRRVNPNLILTLGGPALCTLWQKANITQVRGSILQNPDTGIKLLAAYHPMAISHEWGREPEMLADLAKAKVESASPDIPDDHTEVVFLTTIEEVQWFRDWLFELAPTLESLSIDCETTGLSYLNDEILCMAFTPVRGRDFRGVGYAVPILQKEATDFWGDDLQRVINLLQEIFGGPFSFTGQNCFTPDTRVLTADLRWIPIGELKVGDTLASFDEHNTCHQRRRWRVGTVTAIARRVAPISRVTFEDGSVLKITDDHPLLVRNAVNTGTRLVWKTLRQMSRHCPHLVAKAIDPWEDDTSYTAGWLAGIFDGEGCLAAGRGHVLTVSQCLGPVLDRIKAALTDKGFNWRAYLMPGKKETHHDAERLDIGTAGIRNRGGGATQRQIIRFLGQIRPTRFLDKWYIHALSFYTHPVAIRRIHGIGQHEVVNITTTTGTFVAEGFATHNCKFDQKFIERAHGETSGLNPDVRTAFGFRFRRTAGDRTALDFDTMLGFHLLHEEKPHSLEYQRSLFTTMSYYEAEVRDQTANKIRMADAENETLWQYNASDTDCTGRLTVVHKEAIDREPKLRWLLDNISLPLHDFCRRMELRGALIDRERFDALCADYGRRIVDAEARLLQYHPLFNYRSDDQLRLVLFKDLKLPRVDVKTKASKGCEACQMGFCEDHDGTGAEALQAIREKMRAQKKTPHPILDVLQELSSLTKLKGTYLDGSGGKKKGMLPHITRDGRIHTDYRIDGTETGRLSSSPNMQNIPKSDKDPEFRKLFIAPPGCVFLEADWSQLELRILAYVAGDKSLIAMLESGVDVHTRMARLIWPDVDPDLDDATWEKPHKDLRDRTKGFNFGVGYGITAHTVAKRFGMTMAEAEKMIGMYLRILPSLPVYFHDRRRELILTGGGETVLGRRRRIAGLQTFRNSFTYKKQIGHIQRQLYNFPIQSPGSDIHSLGSIRLDTDDWLLEDLPVPGGMHPRACIVQSVHDSVGMEAVARDVDDPALLETARYIKETLEEIPRTLLGWKLPVELKAGPSWGEPLRQLDKEGNWKDLTAKAS